MGEGANGSFTVIPTGALVAIASPSIFLGLSTVQPSLWTVGGFTFELSFGNVISHPNQHQLTFKGPATIFAPGFVSPTDARWIYTSHIGGAFDFRLISADLVPDSGTTIALLSLGLVAIGVCRPKFAKS
jgi:hypothetical protein